MPKSGGGFRFEQKDQDEVRICIYFALEPVLIAISVHVGKVRHQKGTVSKPEGTSRLVS